MPDYEDYRWLMGEEAGRLLSTLACAAGDLLRDATALRRDYSTGRVHLLLEQVELRRRARAKFAEAERMFFTPVGLEQSTDDWTAAYKADRIRRGRPKLVCDLCCGIGGDLRAIAGGGDAVGIDRDRVAALFAEANCLLPGSPQARVLLGDAARLALDPDVWHIDPDRRASGRRTTRVEAYEPGLEVLDSLRRTHPRGAVKLAPASIAPEPWRDEAELEWISRGGECKQFVAWFDALATTPGYRRATLLLSAGPRPQVRSIAGLHGRALPAAADFGRYLAEPDAAVLAADLTGELAAEHGLSAVAPGAIYLTGDRPCVDPALAWFEVTEVLPFDRRQLKWLLRERRIGHLEVKKRGVEVVPAQLVRELRVPGDEAATLFVVRRGKKVSAVLTRRIRHSTQPAATASSPASDCENGSPGRISSGSSRETNVQATR